MYLTTHNFVLLLYYFNARAVIIHNTITCDSMPTAAESKLKITLIINHF